MTAPGRRSVSYLPGRWSALVTDEICLLSDVHLADPLLAQCWEAGQARDGDGAAAAVLDTLTRSVDERAPSFVLVARSGDAMRLVVAGRAHAEVFPGRQEPVVHGVGDDQAWVDERLDASWDVRLVADDPTPFERFSPLPLTSGIVLASFVFSTVVAEPSAPAASDEVPDEAVGWIPPPLAPAPQDNPAAQDLPGEPPPQLSGVFRALPWRSSLVDAEEAAPAPPPEPNVPPAMAEDDLPAANGAPEPDAVDDLAAPPPPTDKPSFGAPGYVPPPFGAEAYGGEAFGSDVFPPPPTYPPPPSHPSAPPYPPPSAAPPPGVVTPDPPAAPLVQAVVCVNRHPNPLHIESCRTCGAGFASQQPVTVERPPLGVLRLPSGETVLLDRDALLGRAPFAVDQRAVRLVEVASPENDISRSHLRITLDGWQVFATDLGSTNGTAVTLPGMPAALLRPHDPFALAPGAVLSLADEADVHFDVS